MIDFLDLTPSYERCSSITDLVGLRSLGCSEELISAINFGDTVSYRPYIPPEEWFWADREKLGIDARLAKELHAISGGGFVNQSLDEQLKILGLDLLVIQKQRSSKRHVWVSRAGSDVTIEEAALEELLEHSEVGFNCEGGLIAHIVSMTVDVARALFRKEFSLTEACMQGRKSEKHCRQMEEALELLLKDFEKSLDLLWKTGSATGFNNLKRNDLNQFVALAGTEAVQRVIMHHVDYALPTTGHPDLTICSSSGALRFVEVKGSDKLRGSQASWIRDVARPLNLSVTVVRVDAAD